MQSCTFFKSIVKTAFNGLGMTLFQNKMPSEPHWIKFHRLIICIQWEKVQSSIWRIPGENMSSFKQLTVCTVRRPGLLFYCFFPSLGSLPIFSSYARDRYRDRDRWVVREHSFEELLKASHLA